MISFSKRKIFFLTLFAFFAILSAPFYFSLSAEANDDLKVLIARLEKQLEKKDKSSSDDEAKLESLVRRLLISSFEESNEEQSLRTIYDDGFYLKAKDDSLKIGGWLQAGYRASDKADIANNEFFVRRARLDIRGVLEDDWGYRLYGAFEGSSAKLQEGWLEYRANNAFRVRLGQIKAPFSLETMYSARWTSLIERSLGATNMIPGEDLGLMVFGSFFDKKASYALSVHNGQGKNAVDNNSNKEVAGRLTISPLRGETESIWENISLGGSVSKGRIDGSLSSVSYKTASRVSFLTVPANVSQKGSLLRYGTELEWYFNQFKLTSEYLVLKRKHVMTGAIDRPVTTRAWYVTGSYLLTGENAIANKAVVAKEPFSKSTGGAGAWELVARYEGLDTSAAAFDDGVVSGAKDLTSATLGLNWWPNKHVRGAINFVRTDFGEDLTFGDLRRDKENALITQFQFNF